MNQDFRLYNHDFNEIIIKLYIHQFNFNLKEQTIPFDVPKSNLFDL
jgi:hypothetical protein